MSPFFDEYLILKNALIIAFFLKKSSFLAQSFDIFSTIDIIVTAASSRGWLDHSKLGRHRLVVRTPDFHSGNRSSILRGATTLAKTDASLRI